jgi:hypothetical protein
MTAPDRSVQVASVAVEAAPPRMRAASSSRRIRVGCGMPPGRGGNLQGWFTIVRQRLNVEWRGHAATATELLRLAFVEGREHGLTCPSKNQMLGCPGRSARGNEHARLDALQAELLCAVMQSRRRLDHPRGNARKSPSQVCRKSHATHPAYSADQLIAPNTSPIFAPQRNWPASAVRERRLNARRTTRLVAVWWSRVTHVVQHRVLQCRGSKSTPICVLPR